MRSLKNSFLHELQHARDYLDGIDLYKDEMEERAQRAEKQVTVDMAISLWNLED